MADVSNIDDTLTGKVDQLTADAVALSGPIRVKIERVTDTDSDQQPIKVHLVGMLPFVPCLTMRRVMRRAGWEKDARLWAGRELDLYCDAEVTFGDKETKKLVKVGGVRISGMSHIEHDMVIVLPVARGRKSAWPIKKIVTVAKPPPTLASALGDVTIDDLDRYRATESRAAVATLTDDERAKMAAHYAANPRALDKCRAWVAANPKPTETL